MFHSISNNIIAGVSKVPPIEYYEVCTTSTSNTHADISVL